jgi:OPA family glycerol-3-phosphate transporter-like MFS transporter
MAVISLSYLFGDALSREIMSVLLAHGIGWRGIFGTGAGILFVLLLMNLFFLRETPEEVGLAAPQENPLNLFSAEENTQQEAVSPSGIFKQLLGSSTFWLVCVLSLCTTLLRETFNLWTPMYFTQAVGLTNAQAAGSSALFPFFGGLSVILAGVLSDFLGPRGRSRILSAGLLLCGLTLLALARVPAHGNFLVPVSLVALVAFLLLGPYSYLAGAISLDFGGKQGCATASGIIDGVGYLAGVLSGNAMAHLAVSSGWPSMFRLLAGVAFVSSGVAALMLWQLRHRAAAIQFDPAAS